MIFFYRKGVPQFVAGVMLLLLAVVTLIVFSPSANSDQRADLVYNLLGHLDYDGDGGFAVVDDDVMRAEMAQYIRQYQLNSDGQTAYVVRRDTGKVVWSAHQAEAPRLADDYVNPLYFDTISLSDSSQPYQILFVTLEPSRTVDPQFAGRSYQVAVQNFWVRGKNSKREEYQIVVAFLES